MELKQAWDEVAEAWIEWARAPDHDSYWRFHRRYLLGLLPAPGAVTLDVGCGEGRVGRDLAEIGHHVISLDPSSAMVTAAEDAAGPDDGPLVRGDGIRLPFASGSVDLVVAFMSVQDMDEPERFFTEAARVLMPGGRVHLAIVHPLNSGGYFEEMENGLAFVLREPYLERRTVVDEIERSGLRMSFASEHRPMEQYSRWLERAGFVIERLREPTSPEEGDKWRDIPLFAHLVAIRPPVSGPTDRRLFHISSPDDAERLRSTGRHEPVSLATEGFVHCSTAAQVVASTERHFAADAELVLVELDPELVEDDVRWPEVYPGQRFPHLHGPLTASSVVSVHPWGPADRRAWGV